MTNRKIPVEKTLEKTRNLERNLMAQVERLARHNRQLSYKSRKRYQEAMMRYCKYLAAAWQLEKIRNISGKHLEAYAQYLQDCGKAPSTIKTELSAIRFWHDKMDDGGKYPLPSNKELLAVLERREYGKVDRTWSGTEYERYLELCREAGKESFADVAQLARHLGLRIHEAFWLDTATAEKALRTGILTVKGKNGKWRDLPVEEPELSLLKRCLKGTRRGHKLFVPDEVATHRQIEAAQHFLLSLRKLVRDPGSTSPLTYHGLRHNYAVERYNRIRDAQLATGASENDADHEARQQVSRLLGHERLEVTRIYLASLQQTGDCS